MHCHALLAALFTYRHIKQDAKAVLKAESVPDFWKAVLGSVVSAIGPLIGACIAFLGVWLTQRSTAERERRKSDQDKEAALRSQALQFITDAVSAARAMSALTYYAGASPKGTSGISARVREYEKEIALLLVKIQAGQIAISFMADKLEDAARVSWEAVRDQADQIDDAITTKAGDAQVQAIARIHIDIPGIIDPLRKDFSKFLSPNAALATLRNS